MDPQHEPAAVGLPLESVAVDGVSLRKGSSVRLERPPQGRKGIVRRIDMDFEGRVYVGVELEAGEDSGRAGSLLRCRVEEIVPISS